VYQSALTRPDAVKNALINIYTVRRAAQLAISEGLVEQDELLFHSTDGADRFALERFVSKRVEEEYSASDWDALAREYYQVNRQRYEGKRQANVKHILIKSEARTFNQLVAAVSDLEAKLRSGGDFEDLAREYSEDRSVTNNGGNLGYVKKGKTDPAFEKAVFAAEPGILQGPVLTSFGVHFFEVSDFRTTDEAEYSSLRPAIVRRVQKQRRGVLRGDVLRFIKEEAASQLMELDQQSVVDSVGLQIGKPTTKIAE
jgi:parvulin-like peptidyl-prolyl isomerase